MHAISSSSFSSICNLHPQHVGLLLIATDNNHVGKAFDSCESCLAMLGGKRPSQTCVLLSLELMQDSQQFSSMCQTWQFFGGNWSRTPNPSCMMMHSAPVELAHADRWLPCECRARYSKFHSPGYGGLLGSCERVTDDVPAQPRQAARSDRPDVRQLDPPRSERAFICRAVWPYSKCMYGCMHL